MAGDKALCILQGPCNDTARTWAFHQSVSRRSIFFQTRRKNFAEQNGLNKATTCVSLSWTLEKKKRKETSLFLSDTFLSRIDKLFADVDEMTSEFLI